MMYRAISRMTNLTLLSKAIAVAFPRRPELLKPWGIDSIMMIMMITSLTLEQTGLGCFSALFSIHVLGHSSVKADLHIGARTLPYGLYHA